MTHPYHRTPIKMQEAQVAAEVVSETASGQEPDLVIQAAKAIELHRLNVHMARIADALDRLAPK